MKRISIRRLSLAVWLASALVGWTCDFGAPAGTGPSSWISSAQGAEPTSLAQASRRYRRWRIRRENSRDPAPQARESQEARTATESPAPDAAGKPASPARANADHESTPMYLTGVKLIPRQALFGNPDKTSPRLSPDGSRISYLAPVDGVLNVWVGPADDLAAAKPITHDKKRGIRSQAWAFTNRHILYIQDENGDENWHVYSVNLDTGETKDLTPLPKVNAQLTGVSHRSPLEVVVGINDRNAQLHDLHRINVDTGERTLLAENQQGFIGYSLDDDLRVRFGQKFAADGGTEIYQPASDGSWEVHTKVPMEDSLTTAIIGFDKSGDTAYLMDSRGRDTGALVALNLTDGTSQVLVANELADVGAGILMHPTENTLQAVPVTYLRREWEILDAAVGEDFAALAKVANGEIEVVSRTLDDQQWLVAFLMDDGPVRYFHYDRNSKQARFLFTNRKALEDQPLVKMHSLVIESRDGLNLPSYLTLPAGTDTDGDGRPSEPVPTVLLVHGGPWGRDDWGFDPLHQLLANRGYAVLSVNFRASTGFGKEFLNAGNQEWAGKMHDDLIDAVNHAVAERISTPDKIAIMGGSYGGYATLVGLTFTPEVFACGVDIVGPSNILTLLSTIPPYWQPIVQLFKDRVGDFTADEGKRMLTQRSPLSHVDKIAKPLLIGQGANDPRVKQAESDQIVAAMKDKNIPVTYVLFPDEGHGFVRPENNLAFFAVAEAFLARELGGRFEPLEGAFEGSSITVPHGADEIPGLSAALPEPAEPAAAGE